MANPRNTIQWFLKLFFRVFVYSWIIIFIISYSSTFWHVVQNNVVIVLVLFSFVLFLFQYKKYDVSFIKRLVLNKKGSIGFLCLYIGLWGHLGYEWLSRVHLFTSTEPYIYYEGNLIILGFPSSILGIVNSILTIKWLEQTPNVTTAFVIWAGYFVFAIMQLLLIYRFLKNKVFT